MTTKKALLLLIECQKKEIKELKIDNDKLSLMSNEISQACENLRLSLKQITKELIESKRELMVCEDSLRAQKN